MSPSLKVVLTISGVLPAINLAAASSMRTLTCSGIGALMRPSARRQLRGHVSFFLRSLPGQSVFASQLAGIVIGRIVDRRYCRLGRAPTPFVLDHFTPKIYRTAYNQARNMTSRYE